MRNKIARFIITKIAKIPEGCIMPKWCRVVMFILYPLRGLYARQAGIHYDALRNTYTIDGLKFSAQIFKTLHDMKPGELFWFVKREDTTVIIETYSQKIEAKQFTHINNQ